SFCLQAEDGIRDSSVTGVQTCALPISAELGSRHLMPGSALGWATLGGPQPLGLSISGMQNVVYKDKNWDYHQLDMSADIERAGRSEERRVGKGGGERGGRGQGAQAEGW